MDLQKMPGIIRFGAFELDSKSGELHKSGLKIHLREQPFHILSMLLERPGEIITREEIQKILWPNDTVVEFEHSVVSRGDRACAGSRIKAGYFTHSARNISGALTLDALLAVL